MSRHPAADRTSTRGRALTRVPINGRGLRTLGGRVVERLGNLSIELLDATITGALTGLDSLGHLFTQNCQLLTRERGPFLGVAGGLGIAPAQGAEHCHGAQLHGASPWPAATVGGAAVES